MSGSAHCHSVHLSALMQVGQNLPSLQDPRLLPDQTQSNGPPLTKLEAKLGFHLDWSSISGRMPSPTNNETKLGAAAALAACGGALCKKAWTETFNGPLFILSCFPFVFSFPWPESSLWNFSLIRHFSSSAFLSEGVHICTLPMRVCTAPSG